MDRAKRFRNIVRTDTKTGGIPVLRGVFTVFPLLSLFGFSFDPGVSTERVLQWENAVRWMEAMLPLLQYGGVLIVFYWVTALLPMSIFSRMRPLISTTLRISSLFLGGLCWWHSFIVTYRLLGWFSVLMGLLFAGVGVVPLALLGTAIKGDWVVFGNLMVAAALTVIARAVANFTSHRSANTNLVNRASTYYIDD